jgi:hypothetical protein
MGGSDTESIILLQGEEEGDEPTMVDLEGSFEEMYEGLDRNQQSIIALHQYVMKELPHQLTQALQQHSDIKVILQQVRTMGLEMKEVIHGLQMLTTNVAAFMTTLATTPVLVTAPYPLSTPPHLAESIGINESTVTHVYTSISPPATPLTLLTSVPPPIPTSSKVVCPPATPISSGSALGPSTPDEIELEGAPETVVLDHGLGFEPCSFTALKAQVEKMKLVDIKALFKARWPTEALPRNAQGGRQRLWTLLTTV